MKEISCKCGSSKKRFMLDIGPFFINECCVNSGYDHLGNLKESEKTPQVESILENVKKKYSKKASK